MKVKQADKTKCISSHKIDLGVQAKVLNIGDSKFGLELESSPRVWTKDPDPNL